MSTRKQELRNRRRNKIRKRILSNSAKPRLVVFRSNSNIYAQIIDDKAGKTLASASDLKVKDGKKSERAFEVGKEVAKKAKEMKVSEVAFDRNGYKYHGRVKALADGAREEGLKF